MSHFVYIIYSQSVDKFYVGETVNVQERIKQHNSGVYKNASSKIATDWNLFLKIECKSRTQALQIERHIKKMKSRKYLENLKKFPEMRTKLIIRFDS
jgi:putative endonuclease